MARVTSGERLAYRLRHRARTAWYYAHLLATSRIAAHEEPPTGGSVNAERGQTRRPSYLQARMEALYEQDWRNIEQGLYRPPEPFDSPIDLLAKSGLYFRDLRQIGQRRRRRAIREIATPKARQAYPGYYLQNFHYQTDGYLSSRSARLYDFQVETLFSGAADTMRRQALAPLSRFLSARGPREARLLDVASGTGRFLHETKANWPRLHVTALDLSTDYLRLARKALRPWSRAAFLTANAESMPLADASQDAATAIFLFHELPCRARANVAREIARVLRPAGLFVLVDSVQLGDAPELDRHIENFPRDFHEPYYGDYARSDLAALFGEAGLVLRATQLAFLSKVMTFERA